METTPEKINAHRHQQDIARHLARHIYTDAEFDELERKALKLHPPLFRSTKPVSSELRAAEVQFVKRSQREPKRKQHVLP